jgi:DNA-binding beta-propeller fold protein YncE
MLGSAALVAMPGLAGARSVYVSNAGTGVGCVGGLIRAMSIGADGTPTGFDSTLPGGSPAQVCQYALAMSADAKRLYSANWSSGNVTGYDVGADGKLTRTGTGGLVNGPRGMAIAPDGRHLYVANTSVGNVSVIDISGSAPVFVNAVAASGGPYGLALTPDGKHLYVANETADNITGFNVNSDGAIAKVADFPFPPDPPLANDPRGIAVSPDGRRLFAVSYTAAGVSSFTIEASGILTPIGNFPSTASSNEAIAVSPSGQSLFVAQDFDTVTAFNVAGDGSLSQAGAAVSDGGSLGSRPGIAVSPDGRFVYSSTMMLGPASRLAAFNVESSGGLTALTLSPFNTSSTYPDFQSVVITPNQGPNASFTSKSVSNPGHVVFDGSASTDADGSIVRYDWDFGDGQTLSNGGPNPSHDYQAPGAYSARLTLADNEGCSSTTIYTGQTASCNGAASALTKSVGVLGLKLSGKTQKLSRNGIKLDVDCVGVTCALDLGATVKLSKAKARKSSATKKRKPKKSKTVKFRSVKSSVDAGKHTTITLGLSNSSYRKLKSALRRKSKLTATVTASATAGGVTATATSKVKISRPAKAKRKHKK